MQYSIVFTGKIRPGATLEETRRNLAEMFNIEDPALLDRVFSGQRVVLKKGLSEDEARRQEMVLFVAGAACEIKNNAPPAPVAPAPQPAVAAEPPAPAPAAAVTPRPRPAIAVNGLAPQANAPHSPLALVPEPPSARGEPEPMPAALRGYTQPDPPVDAQRAADAAAVKITNLGRDGEGFIDPMLAPWDPAFMPDGVRGLSWAGFLAPLLWGSFNGMRLSFLPILGIRLFRAFVPPWAWGIFYLAFGGFYLVRGRELAWQNKQWRNGEHFNRVQRYWTIGSFAFFLLSAWGLVHLTITQQKAKRLAAQAELLANAELEVDRATAPDQREAAKAKRATVRTEYLASIDDPAERERERQEFAEEDRQEASNEEPAPAEDAAPPSSE